MQSMYMAMMREGRRSRMSEAVSMESGAMFLAMRLDAKSREIDDNSRVSYFQAFGVTPDEQVALEEYYDAWHVGAFESIDSLLSIPNSPL